MCVCVCVYSGPCTAIVCVMDSSWLIPFGGFRLVLLDSAQERNGNLVLCRIPCDGFQLVGRLEDTDSHDNNPLSPPSLPPPPPPSLSLTKTPPFTALGNCWADDVRQCLNILRVLHKNTVVRIRRVLLPLCDQLLSGVLSGRNDVSPSSASLFLSP